ncbi:putative F-box-like domain superfamily protein [Helianthus anomalus]
MVYLSFDMVLFEILTRLNARSTDRYKCVCRQWCDGLSSFEFLLLHSTYVRKLFGKILSYTIFNIFVMIIKLFFILMSYFKYFCTQDYLRDKGFYVVNEYYAEFWPPEQLQKFDFLDEN